MYDSSTPVKYCARHWRNTYSICSNPLMSISLPQVCSHSGFRAKYGLSGPVLTRALLRTSTLPWTQYFFSKLNESSFPSAFHDQWWLQTVICSAESPRLPAVIIMDMEDRPDSRLTYCNDIVPFWQLGSIDRRISSGWISQTLLHGETSLQSP